MSNHNLIDWKIRSKSSAKKSYPVIRVSDGDKSFGISREITDWLIWTGFPVLIPNN
jgi:hypothetical protein